MQAAAHELKPAEREEVWPALPLEEWQDTYATLHMWTQVVCMENDYVKHLNDP